MMHVTGAIVVVGLLLAGATLPAEAAGARGGGGRGGIHGWHPGSPRTGSAWHPRRPWGGRGFHRGGAGWQGGPGVFIGGGLAWWGWPGWWDVPAPTYAAPPVVIVQAPPAPITQAPIDSPMPAPTPHSDWHFCQQAGVYYPNGTGCPGGLLRVGPHPVAPGP